MAVRYVPESTVTPASSRGGGRWSAGNPVTTTVTVSLIALVSVGLPVALAWFTGSLGIPHNDAWSHAVIAQTYARTGDIELVGWNRTGLLGQIVVLGPLGASVVAQHLFIAILACIGLLATYRFLQPRAGVTGALFGTAVVAFVPEYGLLATSYMSDMPAFVAVIACLTLADSAMRRGSMAYLSLAVLIGLWGATVREQAIVAPIVAVVCYALVWRRQSPRQLLLLTSAAGVFIVLFELYRRGLPYGDPPQFDVSFRQGVDSSVHMAFTLALYTSPAIALAARPHSWPIPARIAAAVTLGSATLFAVARKGEVFLGNYLDSGGAYSSAAAGSRELLPTIVMYTLVVIGCVALSALVGATAAKALYLDRVSTLFALALLAGTAAQAFLGQGVFGRYLLPLMPVALAVILSARHRHPQILRRSWWMWPPSLALLGAAVCLSVALTANALAFDAARWKVAEQFVAAGVPADDIDAGLEWVGYHADSPAQKVATPDGDPAWYVAMFPGSRACVTVAASRLDGRQPSATYSYPTFAVFGHSELAVYHRRSCH